MPLTIRAVKGSNLTAAEVDANFLLPRAITVFFKGALGVGDNKIVVKAPHGGTINEITTIAASGSGTLGVKINGSAVTATLNAVSVSEVSVVPTGANVWAPGDDLIVSVATSTGMVDVSMTIKYTPT